MNNNLDTKPGGNLDERNTNGQFLTGHKGITGNGAGRPRNSFRNMIDRNVSLKQWSKILKKAAEMAENGDVSAMRFLVENRYGKPKESVELTGKDRGPIEINDAREHIAGRLAEYAAKQSAQGDTSGTD